MDTTKCPIVLTCNQLPATYESLDCIHQPATYSDENSIASYLHTVAAVEYLEISPSVISQLVRYLNGDIRRLLLALQLHGKRSSEDDSNLDNERYFNSSFGHILGVPDSCGHSMTAELPTGNTRLIPFASECAAMFDIPFHFWMPQLTEQ